MVYPTDNELRSVYTVVSRTASYVTLTGENDRRCKVHVRSGEEFCYPDGRYSMCPVLSAARLKTGAASKPSTPAKVKPKLPTSNAAQPKRNDKGKTEPLKWGVEDMRYIAQTGKRFVERDASKEEKEILSGISIEVGNHPGLKNSLFLKYDVKNGPKGFVSLAFAGPNQMTDMGRKMRPGYFYLQAFQRYRGNDDVMVQGDYKDPEPVALIAANILRKVIKTELAKRPAPKKKSTFLDEHIIITRPKYRP